MERPLDRNGPPPPEPPRPLSLPAFEEFRLDCGLRIHIAERHALPEVSLRLIVEGGAVADGPARAGAAELTGRLLTEGADGRPAPEMAEWLDQLGAAFGVSVGYDTGLLSIHTLSDVLEGALDYLAAVTLRPSFDPAEVARVRQERLDEIERERDEPSSVANRALIAAIYGDHPYGRPADGLYDTVSSLDSEAVRGFHDAHYTATDAALVVCGDVRTEALVGAVEARFGAWSSGSPRGGVPAAPEAPAVLGRVVLVDRPGSAQSEIRVGAIGAPHKTPDYFEMVVANAILGGLFNSRVNMNLREDKGWTYGARSSFAHRRGAGPFIAGAAVETGVTADAFSELLSEIAGLASNPPTDEEMRLAKNALTLSLPRQFETVSQVTRRVASQVIYDLAPDYWERYRERIEAVDREGVVAVVNRYLRAESLVLAAVADAEAVVPSLERFGPVEVRPAP